MEIAFGTEFIINSNYNYYLFLYREIPFSFEFPALYP